MVKKFIKSCIKIAFVTTLCALVPVQILLDHALYAVEEAIATFREAVVNIDRLIEDNWEIVARETRQICNTNTTPRASITEQPDGDEIEAPKWSAKGINSVVDYI
ncbi:hypothetical protein FB192DRAFT_1392982 [Mucor lusitanicus]|uniref:Uncharacterized protein n=1 Tax=Mucor circinelloides f. lusitanicus TaxID=29924 RepID=A0A8H4BC31_MUCCL|nr:hypothetical protein FB192DRAFT_1392982 [Mucor lusitanicus]